MLHGAKLTLGRRALLAARSLQAVRTRSDGGELGEASELG